MSILDLFLAAISLAPVGLFLLFWRMFPDDRGIHPIYTGGSTRAPGPSGRAEKDRAHHGFNPGCHLLGGDTVRGLEPAACGSKNRPGSGGRW